MLVLGTAALMAPVGRGAAERPLVTVGWMTDTHIGKTRESCAKVEAAYRLFKAKGVDVILNSGDIAEQHSAVGYAHYRAVADEVYAGCRPPLELTIFAWHDAYEWAGSKVREISPAQRTECYAALKQALRIPHERLSKHVLNGVTFITIDQWHEGGDLERMMTEAERESRGLPIFVIDHVPPQATTHNSLRWGQAWSRKIYDRHPQCIVLSGHTHGSLRDENLIYQGNLTAVNAGCLQHWEGKLVGNAGRSKPAYGVIVFEVFANRVVFHRHDIRDGREYRSEAPWCVPYPLDPATAPYALERRRASSIRPEFAAGAYLRVAKGAKDWELLVPQVAKGEAEVYKYRIQVRERQGAGWRLTKDFEAYAEFYLPAGERHREVAVSLDPAELAGGRQYRLTVTPLNFFGVAGKALTVDFGQ